VVSHESGRYYFGGESLRILIVEDETKVARALQEGLEREEYDVVVARTGEEGFYLVSAEQFDLVILDLMLPGRDGLQVLSTIRRRGLVTPVLILTARDAIEDRVQGLDSGADDYLVKPKVRSGSSGKRVLPIEFPGNLGSHPVTREETSLFPGDGPRLRGREVKILWVGGTQASISGGARWATVRAVFRQATAGLDPKEGEEGIVVAFDSADGGLAAATLPDLQRWVLGELSDEALRRLCLLDPSDAF